MPLSMFQVEIAPIDFVHSFRFDCVNVHYYGLDCVYADWTSVFVEHSLKSGLFRVTTCTMVTCHSFDQRFRSFDAMFHMASWNIRIQL